MSNISVFAVNTAIFDGHDPDIALRMIHEAGFKRVEFAYNQGYVGNLDPALFGSENAERLNGLMKKYSLECVALGCTMNLGSPDAVESFRQRIRFAPQIGARYLNACVARIQDRAQLVANLRVLAPEAAKHGCKICIENAGDDDYNVFVTAEDGRSLLEDIGHPAVAFNADAGNMVSYRDRIDPVKETLALLPNSAHCHLKDVIIQPDGSLTFPALGQGGIDYVPILKELVRLQIPYSMEIPLRMHRRAGDAMPVRGSEPMPLEKIKTVLDQSMAYVSKVVS